MARRRGEPISIRISFLAGGSLSSRKYIHLSLFAATHTQPFSSRPKFCLQIFIQSAFRFPPAPVRKQHPQGLKQSIFGFPPKWHSHIPSPTHDDEQRANWGKEEKCYIFSPEHNEHDWVFRPPPPTRKLEDERWGATFLWKDFDLCAECEKHAYSQLRALRIPEVGCRNRNDICK